MISVGIRQRRKSCQQRIPKVVSIACGLANNRIQAVSSASEETI